jgi:hypothetical protein
MPAVPAPQGVVMVGVDLPAQAAVAKCICQAGGSYRIGAHGLSPTEEPGETPAAKSPHRGPTALPCPAGGLRGNRRIRACPSRYTITEPASRPSSTSRGNLGIHSCSSVGTSRTPPGAVIASRIVSGSRTKGRTVSCGRWAKP